jgi:nitrogen fixation/metabolism regulation signal transduction histidine kinase
MKHHAFARGRVSLQIKVVIAVLLLALTPLAVSAYLVDEMATVAANFAAGEARARELPMERALETYRQFFEVSKRLHAEVAARLAAHPQVVTGDASALPSLLESEAGVHRLRVEDAAGATVADAVSPLPDGDWRAIEFAHPRPGGGRLRVEFAVPARLQDEYLDLKASLDEARSVAEIRSGLSTGYRQAFLLLMAAAVAIAVGFGLFAARRLTRRISALVTTARAVSAGQTEARVSLRGRDEMAELATAFNSMLDNLDAGRRQIAYLQRIGAWQDVARRLAHEIKNPLTPIQLAVQQCVSSYPGEDPRHAKLLADTGEIVEEEIAGLRRLVDTFRTLGQLPKVEAAPVALGDVVRELLLDPTLARQVVVRAPEVPVMVRADKLLLKRVLANLVENGIHAGEEAGTSGDVVITWAPATAGLVGITVDDQGKGVAMADRERIFEPYVTSKATGTGLGLAISRKLALEHGGDLWVDPAPAPSGGARFVVQIPAA